MKREELKEELIEKLRNAEKLVFLPAREFPPKAVLPPSADRTASGIK
ncbi:hypothetical protein [Melioribacter roseus]|nr:hypothetical protein [Melioribacter roseus]